MTALAFGQPLGSIVQHAYVVDDLDRSIADLVDRLGVGPWSVRERFRPPDALYRGRPATAVVSLGRAFSGHVMVELIQQHDDTPSVFHEGPGPRRYGFHHWAVMTEDLDGDLARYTELGYAVAFSDRLPSGSRVVYVDSTRDLPGMLELIEHTEAQERFYADIHTAAVGWDGRDPIRRDGHVNR